VKSEQEIRDEIEVTKEAMGRNNISVKDWEIQRAYLTGLKWVLGE